MDRVHGVTRSAFPAHGSQSRRRHTNAHRSHASEAAAARAIDRSARTRATIRQYTKAGEGDHHGRRTDLYAARTQFVMWSAILGYAFDFYNLIVVAFLLVPIQKSLNVTLAQTGLIVGHDARLLGAGRHPVRLAWRQDRPQERAAVDAAAARHRFDPVGGGVGLRLAAHLPHHHRHRRRRRMGRRHGAAERGLGQQEARPRQRHRAGDVVGRHRDGLDRRHPGADLFRCRTPHGASRSASAACRCC